MNFATAHRMTHPRLFNTARFTKEGILTAGPCVIAAAHAAAGRELYEVLFETTKNALCVNPLNPDDCVGAVTYIKNIKSLGTTLEMVDCTTIGVKNIDVT